MTAVLPGRFSGRRADAVVITGDNASLCRGPDYRRCLPMGSLPTTRTVATTVKGESLLLVLDNMSSIRACSVDATRDNASINCKAVDNSKLKDFNVQQLAGGQLLVIEGTDGKYACSQGSGAWPSCSQARPSKAERKMARKQGKVFRPLDQPDKVCRVKKGEIECGSPIKLSELDDDPIVPMMRKAALYYDFEPDEEEDYIDIALEEVVVQGTYGSADPTSPWWWSDGGGGGVVQPPPPPNYYQQQCLAVCAQQDIDYADLCRITALALVWDPILAAGYFIACEAGRAIQNQYCRRGICGV